jgi:eukaryotic-like serine/threonine-protein kinase
MTTTETVGNTQTLALRIGQGRIPVPEALRYGMILAEALRKVHDAGQAHGAVSPGSIAITRTGLELLPALGSVGEITPYTAPEVVEGRPADSRSDIFSFGTILYEMLTGHPAFTGAGAALAAALTTASPAPSGSPAVDRLVASCIAKDPAARWQRMQKLLLELKLLAVAVQRAETPRREPVDPMPAIRAELQQMESRLAARLESSETAIETVNGRISGIEQAVKDSVAGMGRLEQAIEARISQFERAATESISRAEKAAGERIARVEESIASAGGERMERLERAVEGIHRDAAALRESVSEDLGMFDKALKSQNTAIESARTAMAQTDDLVERVVEALESLQSVVLEHSDERVATAG